MSGTCGRLRGRLAILLAVSLGALLMLQVSGDQRIGERSILNSDKLVIIIDKSGSIGNLPGGMPHLKQKAENFLQGYLRLGVEGMRVAVLAFDYDEWGILPVAPLTTLSEASLPYIIEAIEGIPSPGGYTDTADAVYFACDILNAELGTGAGLILTDGLPNRPGGEIDAKIALEEAIEYFEANCSLMGVVGLALDSEAKEYFASVVEPGMFISVSEEELEQGHLDLAMLRLCETVSGTQFSDGFESGGFNRLPWEVEGVAIDTSESNSGACAAELSPGGWLHLDYEVPSGVIAFYRHPNEEGTQLSFYIDGELMGYWYSEDEWVEESFYVEEGVHCFEWFNESGECCAEVDDICFFPD